MTKEDLSYTDESWSESSRADLRRLLAQIPDKDCRKIIDALLSEPDPALLVATLRGALIGLAKKRLIS